MWDFIWSNLNRWQSPRQLVLTLSTFSYLFPVSTGMRTRGDTWLGPFKPAIIRFWQDREIMQKSFSLCLNYSGDRSAFLRDFLSPISLFQAFQVYSYKYQCIQIRTCIYIHVCIHVCVRIYIRMFICVCVCICVYIFMYIWCRGRHSARRGDQLEEETTIEMLP